MVARRYNREVSGYESMWLVAMFDLPVLSKAERRAATQFRQMLIKRGFMMLQLSVYARFCASEEASGIHRKYVSLALPAKGEVRLIAITDRQFAKMEVFFGRKQREPEPEPEQILLF
jgi:CRISPR-associated protein Cas2